MSDAKKPAEASKKPAAGAGLDIDALVAQAQSRGEAWRREEVLGGRRCATCGRRRCSGWGRFFSWRRIAAFATKPDYDVEGSLAKASRLLDEGDSTSSLTLLNGRLLDKLGVEDAPKPMRLTFHRLRLAAMFHEIRAKNLGTQDNYRRVLSEIRAIEALGGVLDAGELARAVESHLALGDLNAAIERVNEIPSDDADNRRQMMLKQVIRAAMDSLRDGPADARSSQRFDQALALLTRLGAEASLDEKDRVWTIARQAELRLEAGYNAEAIGHLLREMQRLDALDSEQAGELYLLLGRAYFNLGQFDEAARRLSQSDATLGPTDAKRATANVLLARTR